MHYTMTGALARRVAERLHQHKIDKGHITYRSVIRAMAAENIASPRREVRGLLTELFIQPSQTEHYRWVAQQIAAACAEHCDQREHEHANLIEALFPFVEEIVEDLKREDA